MEFNIFSYEFLCIYVVYVFLYGNTLIFDYCFYSVMPKFQPKTMFYAVLNWKRVQFSDQSPVLVDLEENVRF